jgi:hypothetical protein
VTDPIDPAAPNGVVIVCQRCGDPMPPLPDDLASLARKIGGVSLTHDVCPRDTAAAATAGRYFEVRVSIVEVTEPAEPGPFDPEAPADAKVEELVSFRAGHRAPTLDDAMRPLAEALGERWMKAEKQAAVADSGRFTS